MLSKTSISALVAAGLLVAAPVFAQDEPAADDSMAADDGAMATDDGAMATDDGAMATDDAMAGDAMAEGTAPDLTGVSTALEAATAAGLIETLASGEAYTAFIPTNEAITAVQDAATEAMGDEAAFATLIQGYVVEGTVMAADAMTMVTDGSGTYEATSLAGTPLTLAMDGETLTVNGAPVTQPDIMLGNVVIHVIDGAFLPES